jgi:hypothetical protein
MSAYSGSFSGSFSGSYIGNGSQLTNIDYYTLQNLPQTISNFNVNSIIANSAFRDNVNINVKNRLNAETVISSSAQISASAAAAGFGTAGAVLNGLWSNIAEKPAGLMSSSAQTVTNLIDADLVVASISGSLVLDLNGGYQMTASAGNYTSLMDFGTGTLIDESAYTDGKGLMTTFKGTYTPITSSLFNGEILLDVGVEIPAAGIINQIKYSGSINSILNIYQDFSQAFSNPAGTNINFLNLTDTVTDSETLSYAIAIGENVFAGGARGIYLQGSDDTGVGAYLTINESSPSGFIIGSNDANTSGSNLLTVAKSDGSAEFMVTRNDGMIILAQLSSSFSARDDAGAASIGVPTGGLYHTEGTVKIRLS